MEVLVNCRCGRQIRCNVERYRSDSPFIVFCDRCYLNHYFEWSGGKPVIKLQYYFPDD